jgi:coenzyme F420 hydrogenase subunit beta
LKVLNVTDVVESRLCTGCGACAAMAPESLEMIDTEREGRRPVLRAGATPDDLPRETMGVCPGVELTRDGTTAPSGHDPALLDTWGPVLELWEGHASDKEVRLRGSSGGIATALALYCMEREAMAGTLHVRAREDAPVFNETVLSKTREDLLASTGSRYAPASPCEGLGLVESQDAPSVFIGKPCDVAAVQKARKLRPALDKKIGLTIGFFCAGTPTTKGTHELLRRMGIDDPSSVRAFRYRGNGWPGDATAVIETESGTVEKSLTYEQSWGEVLSNHKQWRCNVCADHTGEFADIAVADAWHRPTTGDPGRSLVLARTERGREVLRGAIRAGYVTLEAASGDDLEQAQSYLIRTRGQVWGRVTALRSIGAPFPRFRGFATFDAWRTKLTAGDKIKSLIGTIRRYYRKGINRPARVTPVGADLINSNSTRNQAS